MKRFSVLLIFVLAAWTAAAQTDPGAIVVPADTHAPALPPGTNEVTAPTAAPATVAATNPAPAAAPTARTVPAREMSLDDCVREALQHNLDVQIERKAPQISLYNLRAARNVYDPILNVSGEHTRSVTGGGFLTNGLAVPFDRSDNNIFKSDIGGQLPWGMTYDFSGTTENPYGTSYGGATNVISQYSKTSDGSIQVDVAQPLLKNFWIDSSRLSIRLAKNQLKSSEQGLRLQIITSITAVENAYYELIYAKDNVKVQEGALNIAQTQLDQDRQRVQIGTMAQLDVQQDEAQVATSRANLIVAQYTLVAAQNTLKNLLTDQYSQWHDSDIRPTATLTAPLQLLDLQDSWSKGMTLRPDLLQARLNVESQGIQLKFDRNQLFPELDLIGTYGYGGGGRQYNDTFSQISDRNQPFYMYGAKLSVPLSSVKARNNLKSDKLTLQQYLLKLKQLEQNVMVQIDNTVQQARSAYEAVGATRQARIYAEAALDAEQKKYAVGKSTTFTVLQLQDSLTVARSREIRALADYNEALANLAQAEGSTLDRHHINVEVK
jgi:outer membrane protein